MLAWIRQHLTYANVMATLCLFLLLGGGAWALSRDSVRSGHIKNGQVKRPDLARGAVVEVKLADGSVTTAKIRNGAVTGRKVNEGTLGTVPSAARANDADALDGLDSAQLQRRVDDPCPANSAIRQINPDGSVLCENDDGGVGGAPSGPAGGDLAGNYPNPSIAANAVNGAKVANESLGELDIGPGTIGSSELQTNSVGFLEMQNNSISSAEIVGWGVRAADLGQIFTREFITHVPDGTFQTYSATCNAGEVLLSGGFDNYAGGTLRIRKSERSPTNPNSWDVTVWNTSGDTGWIQISAYCLQA